MTRFAPALLSLILAVTVALSACGVDRDSDVALDQEPDPEAATDGDDDQVDDDAGEDGEGGESADTTAPEPTPPPTTAPAEDVAITVDFDGDTWELTHGELNSVVIPTWENERFVLNAFGGAIPPNFTSGVLGEHLVSEVIARELDELGASVEPAALAASENNILGLVQSWFPESDDPAADADALIEEVPYLDFIAEFQARQQSLLAAIAEAGEGSVEAPCVRHILLETEDDAQTVFDELDGGADFATLAAERSVGPTGPDGGDLGCAPSSNYVPEFAEAVDNAELGEYVGPIETQFGWHVLIVDRFEETQADPTPVANERITGTLSDVDVEVDPRIGTWDPETLTVLPPADGGTEDPADE